MIRSGSLKGPQSILNKEWTLASTTIPLQLSPPTHALLLQGEKFKDTIKSTSVETCGIVSMANIWLSPARCSEVSKSLHLVNIYLKHSSITRRRQSIIIITFVLHFPAFAMKHDYTLRQLADISF